MVIPHWNNAEGATHDTRFCYMGEARFKKLEAMLPDDVTVLGLDEHTACLIDFEKEEAVVRGIGEVTVRFKGREVSYSKGDRFSLDVLKGVFDDKRTVSPDDENRTAENGIPDDREQPFWNGIHAVESAFQSGLEDNDPKAATRALLEMDGFILKGMKDSESEEDISQAREILREMIVQIGLKLESAQKTADSVIDPLVRAILDLRGAYRNESKWREADMIRDMLLQVGIVIEDTQSGSKWRFSQND